MEEIIPVTTRQVEGKEILTCDARGLHGFLKVGRDFSSWLKDRIGKYGFLEGVDFITLPRMGEQDSGTWGGQNRTDYALTLDMAKELAMVENNERGRQVRRYFIACEQRAREISKHTLENMYKFAKTIVEEHEQRLAVEGYFDMVKPIVPIGAPSAVNGRPRNKLVRSYPRTSNVTVSVPDEYRHLFNYLNMTKQESVLLDG